MCNYGGLVNLIVSNTLENMGQDFHIIIDEKGSAPLHAHWYLEFVYVLEGRATHTWNEETHILETGNYFVVGHLSQHAYSAITQNFKIMNVLFHPVFFGPSLAGAKTFCEVLESSAFNLDTNLFLEKPTPHVYRDYNGTIRQLLLQMDGEYRNKEPGYLEMIRAQFTQVLLYAMRSIYGGFYTKGQTDAFSGVLRYIHCNYMHPITLEDLCTIVNYSVPHMSKKFKTAVGMSFSEYLRQLRIQTSQRLLLNSGKSIDRIMEEVGYQDKKSFYAAFRKLSETTPDAYRRAHRQVTLSVSGNREEI